MSLLDDEDILINDDSFLDHIEPNKEYFFEWVVAWKRIIKEAVEQYENSIVDHMYLARLVKKLKDNYWPYYISNYVPSKTPLCSPSMKPEVLDMGFLYGKYHRDALSHYQADCLVNVHMEIFSTQNFETLMAGLIDGYIIVMHYIRFVPNLVNLNEEKVEVYKNWIKYLINKKGTD